MLKQLLRIVSCFCVMVVVIICRSPYARSDPGGLVLWNKLGSQAEIENSVVGPNGTFHGGSFTSGKFGDAYVADNSQDLLDTFPKEVISGSVSTVEVWAKLIDFPSRFVWGGNSYLIRLLGPGQHEYWHHYALVWDELGIPSIGDGTETAAVFVDGQLLSGWRYNEGDREYGALSSTDMELMQFILSQGKIVVDNVKIWNYAKTDFSDRFMEGVEGYIKGDVNGDEVIGVDDAILAMQIAVRLVVPKDHQKWAADIDKDGRVRTNDAILILRMVAGLPLPAPGRDIGVASFSLRRQTTVTLGEAYGMTGKTVTIPLKVDNITGLAGGDVCIAYDPAVLRAVSVSSDSGILLASGVNEPGMVRIAFASAGMMNSETVAETQFDILADDTSLLKLEAVELYGIDALPLSSRSIDRIFTSQSMLPGVNALFQNFPNPFNPETWIPYQLREASEVTIRIYSASGELVRMLDLGYQPAGLYLGRDRSAYWDGRNERGEAVASGTYFYTVGAGDFAATKKMTVIR